MPMVRGRHTSKKKTKLLKYLPRGAFQNPIFSPGRDKQQRLYPSSGFSGPIVSIIPDEARRRPRRGAGGDVDDDDVSRLGPTQEPSSPKVSCIGQIKLRSKEKKNKIKAKKANHKQQQQQQTLYGDDKGDHRDDDHRKAKEEAKANKKQDSKIRKMFGFGSASSKAKKGDAYARGKPEEAAPALGQLRRFSSGRQSLANFDWTAQIAPVNDPEDRNCHSDEEFGGYNDDGDDDEVIIPFSAPILMGRTTEPRREVNLWQRRNTASPPPLELKSIKVRGD